MKLLSIGLTLKISIFLTILIALSSGRKKKVDPRTSFFEPRDEEVNHTAREEMSRITQ